MALMPHFSAGPRSGGLFGSDHRLFTHAVQFYSEPGFLVRGLSGLIRSAFRAGDGVVLLATPDHCESLARQLENEGRDLDTQRIKGCYVVMDPGEALRRCSTGGKLDVSPLMELFGKSITRVAEAIEMKAARVFVFGELVAVLSAQGNMEAALVVENAWDRQRGLRNVELGGSPSKILEPRHRKESSNSTQFMEHFAIRTQ